MGFWRARDIVKQYGGDFFQGMLTMPSDIQKAVVVLYQFVRVPDQMIDDESIKTDEQKQQAKQLIQDYYMGRKKAYEDRDEGHKIFGPVVRIFYSYGIDFGYSESFFQSMLQDTQKCRYETYDELKSYIYGSAEVIGLMMIQIMGYNFDISDPEYEHKYTKVIHCAAKLGEAFQLSNFLRDVHEDLLLGRVYIPQDMLAKYNITHEQLRNYHLTQQVDEAFAWCMTELVDRVDAMHDEANIWITLLNPACQKAIQLSSDLHRWILQRIRDSKYNVFDKKFQKNSFGRLVD